MPLRASSLAKLLGVCIIVQLTASSLGTAPCSRVILHGGWKSLSLLSLCKNIRRPNRTLMDTSSRSMAENPSDPAGPYTADERTTTLLDSDPEGKILETSISRSTSRPSVPGTERYGDEETPLIAHGTEAANAKSNAGILGIISVLLLGTLHAHSTNLNESLKIVQDVSLQMPMVRLFSLPMVSSLPRLAN